MKKTLFSLLVLATLPAFGASEKFGEYSIWCDNVKHRQLGTGADWLIFQPEGSGIEKVTSAYGSHATNNEGRWKVEFDLKVTNLEKDRDVPLLYMELTTTSKKDGNGKGDEVIKTGWVLFDQEWIGTGFLRTDGGSLLRLDCTRGKKSEPKEE